MLNVNAVARCKTLQIIQSGKMSKSNVSSNLGKSNNDYSLVCIGGHEYYHASFATKGFLAIKLNDDGKPIRCVNDG